MWAQVFVGSSQHVLWCTLVTLIAVIEKKKHLNSAKTWAASLHDIDVCYVSVGLHVVARAYMLSVQGTLIKRAM